MTTATTPALLARLEALSAQMSADVDQLLRRLAILRKAKTLLRVGQGERLTLAGIAESDAALAALVDEGRERGR